MKAHRNKIFFVGIIIVLFVMTPFAVYAAQEGGSSATERLIVLERPAPKPVEKDVTTLYSYYEPSTVLTGNNPGRWAEITNGFAYQHKNLTGYAAISHFNRYDKIAYTANCGTYVNIDKNQFAHLEIGFGWLNDYMYNVQTISEYAHRLYKDLFWQIGYCYRAKTQQDSHTIYPGLIYYFGDSYMTADFGAIALESRSTGYYGAIKGNFTITKLLDLWSGVAFGEYLYDIYGLDADQETGYMIFGGVTVKVYKDVFAIKVGGSYGEEAPKFIKRSLIFSGTVKF
jgi:YaiO family outer membrane protein